MTFQKSREPGPWTFLLKCRFPGSFVDIMYFVSRLFYGSQISDWKAKPKPSDNAYRPPCTSSLWCKLFRVPLHTNNPVRWNLTSRYNWNYQLYADPDSSCYKRSYSVTWFVVLLRRISTECSILCSDKCCFVWKHQISCRSLKEVIRFIVENATLKKFFCTGAPVILIHKYSVDSQQYGVDAKLSDLCKGQTVK